MSDPAKTVIEEEEIIQYLHPSLLRLDYQSYTTKFAVIVASLVSFCIVFCSSHFLFSANRTFRSLKGKERVFWNLAVVRAVYGVLASVIGAWTIFCHTNYYRDVVYGQTATGSFAMNVTTGFFLFESLTLIVSDLVFATFSRLLHVHHILCAIGSSAIIFSESGYGFTLMALALEMSTPFSAVCWILLKAGLGRTKIWTINQVVLLHAFHLRSVVECYIWWLTYKEWPVIWAAMPWPSFIAGYTALTLFTFIATPYWGYKKTMQLANPTDWNFEQAPGNQVPNGRAHKIE